MSNEYEYRKSNWPVKIDAQIFTVLVRSQGLAQNRYRRINKFSQLLLCAEKDKLCLKLKSWISFRLLTQLHKLRSQLRGSFLTWNFVLSGFISNWYWESYSTTRWRSWETLANARSVSRFKGKKQLSIVHVVVLVSSTSSSVSSCTGMKISPVGAFPCLPYAFP